jgi:ADP-heptose:LPS heptosyltransferase
MAPRKILAIKTRALGDTVLMTAPLMELIQSYPQSEIHVLVTHHWAPILNGLQGIQKVWTFERRNSRASRARMLARLAFQLRRQKFDIVVNFHASPTSSLLAFATGAPTRAVHFHGHRDKNKFSTVTIPGKGILKPIIERDMDTIRALGLHVPAGRLPQVNLQKSEQDEAKTYLQNLNLVGPILGISLGASRLTKSWPVERYAALAIEWARSNGSAFVFSGPQEGNELKIFLKAVDELLISSFPDSENRAAIRSKITATHQLSLRRLAAVLNQLSVLVGNDSGPKHLAIAVNTPTVTLFGPEHPFEWHPYSTQNHPFLFIENLPCRKDADPGMPPWCGLHTCTLEEHRCMNLIGVDSVLSQCQKVAMRSLKA